MQHKKTFIDFLTFFTYVIFLVFVCCNGAMLVECVFYGAVWG